jgi:prophage regulatory protein
MLKKSLIIRYGDLAEELGISRSTIWRLRRKGGIPSPITLGDRAIGWERSVIENWLKSKRIEG